MELFEVKDKIFKEIAEIKSNVKLLATLQEELTYSIKEVKDSYKLLQSTILKQQSLEEKLNHLTNKINDHDNKFLQQSKTCPVHKVEIENIKTSLEELKQDIKNKNKILIGFLVSIFTYIVYQLINLL